MTTTVTIDAHTGDGIEVEVTTFEDGTEPVTEYLKDGESIEKVVFDTRQINIQEVKTN